MSEASDSEPFCQSGYRSGDLWSYDNPVGKSVVQVLVIRVDIGVVTYGGMTSQCGRSVVQVLVVVWMQCVSLFARIKRCKYNSMIFRKFLVFIWTRLNLKLAQTSNFHFLQV